MKERCYAKINLSLNVKSVREDGYHELEMIMVPIDFYDMLEMVPAEETTLSNNRNYLPVNEKNTVIKAIRTMQKKYGITQEFACTLQKHIPTRAGLAGGSADGAAVIRMMNKMCHLHMTQEEMISIAKEVGSDVPFCVVSKPAFVTGTGEFLDPFHVNTDFEVLLVKPKRGVSTKEAFELCDSTDPVHPDCYKMREALETNDYKSVLNNLGNSLEDAALQLCPEIAQVKKALEALGFDGVLMSGSGSTVFGITKNKSLVGKASDLLKDKKLFVRKTRILQ